MAEVKMTTDPNKKDMSFSRENSARWKTYEPSAAVPINYQNARVSAEAPALGGESVSQVLRLTRTINKTLGHLSDNINVLDSILDPILLKVTAVAEEKPKNPETLCPLGDALEGILNKVLECNYKISRLIAEVKV